MATSSVSGRFTTEPRLSDCPLKTNIRARRELLRETTRNHIVTLRNL